MLTIENLSVRDLLTCGCPAWVCARTMKVRLVGGVLAILPSVLLNASMAENWSAVLKPISIRVGEFCDGLAVVRDKAEFTYVDTAGRNVFGKRFMACYPFREGVAAVIVKDIGLRVINRRGEPITESTFLSVNDGGASEGLVAVATARKIGGVLLICRAAWRSSQCTRRSRISQRGWRPLAFMANGATSTITEV